MSARLFASAVVLTGAIACSSFGAAPVAADVGTDGGADAMGAASQGGPADASPCAHAFCASFDGTTPGQGWDNVVDDLDALTLDTTTSTSAPSSLGLFIKAATNQKRSFVEKILPPASRFRVSVHLRFEPGPGSAGAFDVVHLELNPQPKNFTNPLVVLIGDSDGNIGVELNAPEYRAYPLAGPAADFRRFDIDADLENGIVAFSVDGVPKQKLNVAVLAATGAYLRVGAPYTEQGTANFRLNVDDVTAD